MEIESVAERENGAFAIKRSAGESWNKHVIGEVEADRPSRDESCNDGFEGVTDKVDILVCTGVAIGSWMAEGIGGRGHTQRDGCA